VNEHPWNERVEEGAGDALATPLSTFDTSHLERQVDGDVELRDELLRLYASRLEALGPKLYGTPCPRRREAAHTLKGASLAIGAFALAQLCDHLEAGQEADLRELARVIEGTELRVSELLRGT
jgi:HPt (histidine-containing phosphotransfer) domain-containing protein